VQASSKVVSAGSFVAAILVLTVAGSGASGTTRRQTQIAASATHAFRLLLHDRYGAFSGGYWTCPPGQLFGSQISCEAEFRQRGVWNRFGATANVATKPISFAYEGGVSWVRHWSPYSHYVIAGFGATGVASVNTPDEDWSFIGGGVYYDWKQHRHYVVVDGYDGDGAGLGRFYLFRCNLKSHPITCANRFGDSVRYRPQG
jgi:hypothetical protein